MLLLLIHAAAVQRDSCVQDTVILSLYMGFCIFNPLRCTYEAAAAADRCATRVMCACQMLSCSSLVADLLHRVVDCNLPIHLHSWVWGV
jgi:hypothetical protein